MCVHTYTVACMQNHAVDGDMYVHAGTWMAARIKAPSHPCRVAVRVLACVPSSKYASPPLLAHAFPMTTTTTSTPRPVTKFFYVRSPCAAPLIRWWWMRGWRPAARARAVISTARTVKPPGGNRGDFRSGREAENHVISVGSFPNPEAEAGNARTALRGAMMSGRVYGICAPRARALGDGVGRGGGNRNVRGRVTRDCYAIDRSIDQAAGSRGARARAGSSEI